MGPYRPQAPKFLSLFSIHFFRPTGKERQTINKEKIEEYMQLIEKEAPGKYQGPGLYSISIGDKLVYIGKSMNQIERLANHLCNINKDSDEYKSHKYDVIRDAMVAGYKVSFDSIYQSPYTGEQAKEDIGEKEGYYIRKYFPPLNYQIPKPNNWTSFTTNRKAKTITLEEIMGETKKSAQYVF